MSEKPSFFAELKRRHVDKVALVYAVVSWLLIAAFTDIDLLPTAGMLVLLLRLLQTGYLAGLIVSYAWSRAFFARAGYEGQSVAPVLNSGAR